MQIIPLRQAVREIKQAASTNDRAHHAHFWVVGAGISLPSVPLSTQMVREFQGMLRDAGADDVVEPAGLNAMEKYSFWFRHALPQPRQRQRYIRECIEKKPVTPANWRLAHLMLERNISNLVVTPNFDNLLQRALMLFGQHPLVCDHPVLVNRIDAARDEIQILHVHGSFWHYDCCNLKDEIAGQAVRDEKSLLSVGTCLDNVLAHSSPLVLGYDGWEDDVIMQALKRRLNGQGLGDNIYWFCYHYPDEKRFPDWLRDNPAVYFVAPEPPDESATRADTGETLQPVRPGDDGHPTQTAEKVLQALILAFDLPEPDLTRDPFNFEADYLEGLTGSVPADDLYRFREIIVQFRKGAILIAEQRKHQKAADAVAKEVTAAIRRADYAEAVRAASTLDVARLSGNAALNLTDQMATVCRLSEDTSQIVAAAELLFRLADRPDSGGAIEETVAKAQVCALDALINERRYFEVLAAADTVLTRYGAARAWRFPVARALLIKGFVLAEGGRDKDAIEVCGEVVRRFGKSKDVGLQEQVVKSLYNKGLLLGRLMRLEEEIAVYDEVLRRYSNSKVAAIEAMCAKALTKKNATLSEFERTDKEMAVYDEVVLRFGESVQVVLRQQVADALLNKGVALANRGRRIVAMAAYDDVVRRYGESEEAALRVPVASALFNKALSLRQLERAEEAMAACDEVVSRYENATEPTLQAKVAHAVSLKELLLQQQRTNAKQAAPKRKATQTIAKKTPAKRKKP